jgi:hypothetical protein
MLEMKIDSMGQFLLALPYFDSLGLKINSLSIAFSNTALGGLPHTSTISIIIKIDLI